MRGRRTTAALLLVAMATVVGCGTTAARERASDPLPPGTAQAMDDGPGAHPADPGCPRAPALDAPPERIVTMDGGSAAIIARLAGTDRIVGTAATDFFAAFAGDERAQLDAIPVLDPGPGNAESVIDADPDLVVGISRYSFGGFDGTPTVEQLDEVGAQALVACGATGGSPVRDLTITSRFVRDVATALDVPERGSELVGEIEADIAAATAPAAGEPLRVVALSAAPATGQPVMIQGGASLVNGIIALAGGANVAEDVARDFASLSAEEIVARDPQAIVVISGFSPMSDDELTDQIRSSPVLMGTTAVRENRFVVVPQSIVLAPSVLNGHAVAAVAEALGSPAQR